MLQTRRWVPVVVAVVLAVTAGCGGDDGDDGPKKSGSSVTTGAAPTPTTSPTALVPTPGGLITAAANPGLPVDFPATVPLLAGQVVQPLGGGSGEEGRKGWVLDVTVAGSAEECFEDAATALTRAGFVKQGELKAGKSRQAQFTTSEYAVIISAAPGAKGQCQLGYEVGQIPG